MRVEQRERQDGTKHLCGRLHLRAGGIHGLFFGRRNHAAHPKVSQVRNAKPPHNLECGWRLLNQGTKAGNTKGNQGCIGHGTNHHHEDDVIARESLPNHERVLGTDCNNQAEAGQKSW